MCSKLMINAEKTRLTLKKVRKWRIRNIFSSASLFIRDYLSKRDVAYIYEVYKEYRKYRKISYTSFYKIWCICEKLGLIYFVRSVEQPPKFSRKYYSINKDRIDDPIWRNVQLAYRILKIKESVNSAGKL